MSDDVRRTRSAADSLPPVEPPSAGFLVQLFLVPFAIVSIILTLVTMFYWLPQIGNDPQAAVRALRRNTEGRWQAALNLANDLRGPRGRELRSDPTLLGELASILEMEAASGRGSGSGYAAEQSRTLCVYLSRAIGEFALPEAATPLVARATDVDQPEVARAAVEALAVLAANLAAADRRFADPTAVAEAVVTASRSQEQGLRSSAAFALGVVGGEPAVGRLVELLDDVDDDVRYNAAVGLARLARPEAWDTLVEMLSTPDVAVSAGDNEAQARRYKRVMVVVNALKAVGLLVDGSSAAPPEAVLQRLAALADDAVPDVRRAAVALGRRIDRLGGAGSAALAEDPAAS